MMKNNFKNPIVENFFYKNPTLKSISWTQYVPYYTDVGFKIDMDSVDVLPESMIDKVKVFLSSIDDEFYLSNFGNNTRVSVDRFGITIEEYDDHN